MEYVDGKTLDELEAPSDGPASSWSFTRVPLGAMTHIATAGGVYHGDLETRSKHHAVQERTSQN